MLLSANTLALANEKRQATDAAEFTSAAEQLISQYIPSTVLPELESIVSAAASSVWLGTPISFERDIQDRQSRETFKRDTLTGS